MTRIANFAQFSDDPFRLRIGDDIDKTLSRVIEAHPADGEGALLMWRTRREGSGKVTYTVKVNNTVIGPLTTSLEDRVTVHEALATADIKQGTNTVEFRLKHENTDNSATLDVGDVILWYRQNV